MGLVVRHATFNPTRHPQCSHRLRGTRSNDHGSRGRTRQNDLRGLEQPRRFQRRHLHRKLENLPLRNPSLSHSLPVKYTTSKPPSGNLTASITSSMVRKLPPPAPSPSSPAAPWKVMLMMPTMPTATICPAIGKPPTVSIRLSTALRSIPSWTVFPFPSNAPLAPIHR